jgi:D-aspartate ligase
MTALAPPRGALILGADYRALGAARSLGRRGVPVWVLAERGEPLATVSRYARRSMHWPEGGDEERAAYLRELAISNDIHGWALIPSTDCTAAMLARGYDVLAQQYTHTTPPWDVVRWTYDKRLTYELAKQVGVPCPHTAPAGRGFDPVTVSMPFPAVLKPAIKEESNALTTAKAWRIDDRKDLERRYREACELVDPELLMVQELVFGGGEAQFSYAALCRDGVPLASLTARRTRQYPADFGRASTFVETVDCPEVVEPSLRLLRELRYSGLIEIEYKRDPRDGVLKLLDMNPRLWGWHTLCARAGVDFPWLLWLLVCCEDVPSSRASAGVGWLRFTTDTPTVVKELLGRRLSVREYVRSLRRPRESAIFAWDDPIPGLAELPVLAYVLARRLLHGEAV